MLNHILSRAFNRKSDWMHIHFMKKRLNRACNGIFDQLEHIFDIYSITAIFYHIIKHIYFFDLFPVLNKYFAKCLYCEYIYYIYRTHSGY